MESFTFLAPTEIQQQATEAGLDQTVIEQLTALAQRITNESALRECAGQLFAKRMTGP